MDSPDSRSLLATAERLSKLLEQIEAGAWERDDLVEEAMTLHYELAPVHRTVYGEVPQFRTDGPPYLWMRRVRESTRQALAVLRSGFFDTSSTSPTTPTSDWESREVLIMRIVHDFEAQGAPSDLAGVVVVSGLDRLVVENSVRALLEANYISGVDTSSLAGFDIMNLRLRERGLREVGDWPEADLSIEEAEPAIPVSSAFPYDVAVSFAGQDRVVVDAAVAAMKRLGIRVWYDADFEATLWGQDLSDVLADIYANQARYVMVFLSEHYTDRDWTNFELEVVQRAARRRSGAYVLPVHISEDVPPVVGLSHTVGYISLASNSVDDVAAVLRAKLDGLDEPFEGESEVQAEFGERPDQMPEYEVLMVQDVSFAGVKRLSLHVGVKPGIGPELMALIAQQLAATYRTSHSYRALSVGFYDRPEYIGHGFSLGYWEDAPHGDWARAIEAVQGDYSTFASASHLKDKSWASRPLDDEAAIWADWYRVFEEYESVTEEDAFERVAEQHELEPADVRKVVVAVNSWITQ